MSEETPEYPEPWPSFPAERFWEDLSSSWDGDVTSKGPDPGLDGRHEALRRTARITGKPLPEGVIIEREHVSELLTPLGLDDTSALTERLYAVAGRHLRPRHQAYFDTSAKLTKQRLRDILSAAQALEQLLDGTAVETTLVIEAAHAKIAREFGQAPHLSVHQLSMSLTTMMQAVSWLENSIEIAPKRPPKIMRLQAVADAAQAIEQATELPVNCEWRKSGTPLTDRFKGINGMVLRSFLQLIEPNASEAALVHDLRKARGILTRKK